MLLTAGLALFLLGCQASAESAPAPLAASTESSDGWPLTDGSTAASAPASDQDTAAQVAAAVPAPSSPGMSPASAESEPTTPVVEQAAPPTAALAPDQPPTDAPAAPPSLVHVVRDVSRSVVMITNGLGFGSGVVIDPLGYVLTAAHVVEGRASVTVTFPDGSEERGLVIGRDQIRDLAMVKISGRPDLPTARLGHRDLIAVGDEVLALGYSSFNEGISITAGVVSDFIQEEEEEFGYLQTDAGFYSGQSGGPVITTAGEIVGIVSVARFTSFQAPAGWAVAMDDITLWHIERLKTGEQILEPETTAIGSTIDNPAPFGHAVRVYGTGLDTGSIHDVTVVDVVRGEDANAVVQAAYQFNPPPQQGIDYLLALVRIRYVKGDEGRTDWLHQVDFGMLSSDGIKYFSFLGVVPPRPFLSIRLYPATRSRHGRCGRS